MRRRRVRAGVALVGLLALAVAGTGCEPRPCAAPYRPALAASGAAAPGWPDPSAELRPGAQMPMLDSDRDGRRDTVTQEEAHGTVTVVRGSGRLVLSAPGRGARVVADRPSVGDVDGDGRSDVLAVVDAAGGRPAEWYVVPGGTPDGAYEVAAVGVRLPGVTEGSEVHPLGQSVDIDGLDDVVVTVPDPGLPAGYDTRVVLGRALASTPAGGHARAPVSLGGRLLGTLSTSPTTQVVVVATELGREGGHYELLLWFGGARLELTTAGSPASPVGDRLPLVSVSDTPDGRSWLVLDDLGPSGHSRWAWDVEDVCRTRPVPVPVG